MKKLTAFNGTVGSDSRPKPLIVSACMHGKSDSWATKATIEDHIERAKQFNIIARGVAPQGKPYETPEGLRGVELTLDDIRKSVLILIHSSNEYAFRRRFGPMLTSALDTAGLLYVRTGIECQHLEKNTDRPNGKIIECCKIYRELLEVALSRNPASETIHKKAFERAEIDDAEWHSQHAGKGKQRHFKRKH